MTCREITPSIQKKDWDSPVQTDSEREKQDTEVNKDDGDGGDDDESDDSDSSDDSDDRYGINSFSIQSRL